MKERYVYVLHMGLNYNPRDIHSVYSTRKGAEKAEARLRKEVKSMMYMICMEKYYE